MNLRKERELSKETKERIQTMVGQSLVLESAVEPLRSNILREWTLFRAEFFGKKTHFRKGWKKFCETNFPTFPYGVIDRDVSYMLSVLKEDPEKWLRLADEKAPCIDYWSAEARAVKTMTEQSHGFDNLSEQAKSDICHEWTQFRASYFGGNKSNATIDEKFYRNWKDFCDKELHIRYDSVRDMLNPMF